MRENSLISAQSTGGFHSAQPGEEHAKGEGTDNTKGGLRNSLITEKSHHASHDTVTA